MTDLPAPVAIVETIPAEQWCRHCVTHYPFEHEHRWQPPSRCDKRLVIEGHVGGRCERDAGHDEGPFPRAAWNHGHNGVGRWIIEPTPHVLTWGP